MGRPRQPPRPLPRFRAGRHQQQKRHPDPAVLHPRPIHCRSVPSPTPGWRAHRSPSRCNYRPRCSRGPAAGRPPRRARHCWRGRLPHGWTRRGRPSAAGPRRSCRSSRSAALAAPPEQELVRARGPCQDEQRLRPGADMPLQAEARARPPERAAKWAAPAPPSRTSSPYPKSSSAASPAAPPFYPPPTQLPRRRSQGCVAGAAELCEVAEGGVCCAQGRPRRQDASVGGWGSGGRALRVASGVCLLMPLT